MSHATQEQALHMENRIESSEQALFAFSEKPEITALLKNTDQPDLTETVQLLTEEYSRSIADAEGLGICDNNTRFLAHTNKMVVGMQTRAEANRLEQFHDALLDAGDQVLDCGIIHSRSQDAPGILPVYAGIRMYSPAGCHCMTENGASFAGAPLSLFLQFSPRRFPQRAR